MDFQIIQALEVAIGILAAASIIQAIQINLLYKKVNQLESKK